MALAALGCAGKLQNCFYQIGGAAGLESLHAERIVEQVQVAFATVQAMNAKVQQVLGKVTKNSQAAFLSLRSHAQGKFETSAAAAGPMWVLYVFCVGARGKTSTSTSDFEVLVHPPGQLHSFALAP